MIVIAGYGYVGKAVHESLKDHHQVEIVDPAFNENKVPHFDPQAVIIAVATPQGSDGSCYMGHVFDVLEDTPDNVPVLIKSTISLEGWEEMVTKYPDKKVTFSPEFLRAATAIEDFASQKEIYFGCGNPGSSPEFWMKIFEPAFSGIKYKIQPAKELILSKYFRNSFLATKVAFFNQVFDLCEKIGVDYELVRDAVGADERIGISHTSITGKRGFGGHCFPKDTMAIVKTADKLDVDMSLIREAISYNLIIRKEDE